MIDAFGVSKLLGPAVDPKIKDPDSPYSQVKHPVVVHDPPEYKKALKPLPERAPEKFTKDKQVHYIGFDEKKNKELHHKTRMDPFDLYTNADNPPIYHNPNPTLHYAGPSENKGKHLVYSTHYSTKGYDWQSDGGDWEIDDKPQTLHIEHEVDETDISHTPRAEVKKDWWEEPPKKERNVPTSAKVAAGTAAGLGLGAGAVYLATRGKAGKTVKVVRTVTRVKKVPGKTKYITVKPKPPAAPAPKRTGMRAAKGPTYPRIPANVQRQHAINLKHIGQPKTPPDPVFEPIRGQSATAAAEADPNLKGIPLTATADEVDRAFAGKKVAAEGIKNKPPGTGKVPQRKGKNPRAARHPDLSPDGNPALPTKADAQADVVFGPKTPQQKRAALKAKQKADDAQKVVDDDGNVIKADSDILLKRAWLDWEDDLIFKAITGEKGDKRNTKYGIAGGLGYVAGVNVGDRAGARMAGTTYSDNRRKANAKMHAYSEAKRAKLAEQKAKPKTVTQVVEELRTGKKPKPLPDPATWHPSIKEITRVNNSVKGTKAIMRGSLAGGAAGLGAGMGLMAIYRNDKQRRKAVSKKDERRIDAKTGALLGAGAGFGAGNIVGVPAAAMAGSMAHKGRSAAFTRSLIRFNKSPIVLVPTALGAGLGALGGKGAKDMRQKVKKNESPAMQALLDARRADDPIAKGIRLRKPTILGNGPGALRLKPVQAMPKKPPAPLGDFITYDPGLRTQKTRAAMKGSFR